MAEVENKQVTSKRDTMLERLKSRYPDKDFADDEVVYGQIVDDYDTFDADLAGYKERESTLVDLFNKNPKAAQFITDMAKGNDPWLAVIERLGIDGVMDIMNDPEKKAEYAAANEKYVADVAKSKEIDEEREKNKVESSALLDKVQGEKGFSDDIRNEIAATIGRITQDAVMGIVTQETIDMVLAAITHDADVENARSEGVVAGKNAKIDEKLRTVGEGDGMPMNGNGNATPAQKPTGYNIFDEARGAF